jgi:methylmalonyl-CoA mutase cobalamin-binding domain/chain
MSDSLVIIPTYNEKENIESIIRTVFNLEKQFHILVIDELKRLGRPDIVVIVGGVIPAQDYDFLYKAGVAAIFGPGSRVTKSAVDIMHILMDE